MATESPIRISESSRTWASLKGTSGYGSSSANIGGIDELGLLLNSQTFQGNGRALVPSRSGSAPPSMEGSIAAAKNIIANKHVDSNASLASINSFIDSHVSGESVDAGPAYIAYLSSAKMNPRLTTTQIPSNNKRMVRQIGTAGYDRILTSSDDSSRGSLSMPRIKLPTHREETEDDRSAQLTPSNWPERSTSLSCTLEVRSQLDCVAEMTQEEVTHGKSPVHSQDPPLSLESAEEVDTQDAADDLQKSSYPDPASSVSSSSSLPSTRSTSSKLDVHRRLSNAMDSHLGDHSSSSSVTHTVPASIDSNMSSTSSSSPNPNPQHIRQHNMVQKQVSSEQRFRFEAQNSHPEISPQGFNPPYIGTDQFFHGPSNYSGNEVHPLVQSSGIGPPLYATAAAEQMNSSTLLYQNLHPSGYLSPQYTLGTYAFQSEGLSPYVAGYVPPAVVPVAFDAGARPHFSPQTLSFGGITSHGINLQHFNSYYGHFGYPAQPSLTDSLHIQYFQRPFGDAYGPGQFDHLSPRPAAIGNLLSAIDSSKGSELSAFSADQNFWNQESTGHAYMNPGRTVIPYYVGSPRDTGHLQFPATAVASPVFPGSPVNGTSFFSGTNQLRFSPHLGRSSGMTSGWPGHRGPDGIKSMSFLEEFKSGKGRKLELPDIAGHIIEFSGDQHGSRFIQQKLENCSFEEKESVFKEVLPYTSKLMTDVFGNYVIQKFFEYGSLEQRKQLAGQLAGQILNLSLQMYGCRVIQKALDVIEQEQKIKLVHELDGHVIRCVRDQNGNHVIQKCIETMPAHQIDFIISSFRGQVAKLSTHPYGCRVIQRVLEHCTDDLQSQFIVDEILESVCSLAQDQYGNYVTQHVLERGKPPERHLIITKLSGNIVQLSQHKFASNVVEKCLEYGDSNTLDIIIREIIGQGDGIDNLLTMVKDQYANYVIQRIIQTCSGDQREMLLGRIRTHLNSLKKYTYGKHIVARFEQLYGEESKDQDPDAFTK
ncbi:pumilio homolog 5-like [Apium graveolens]|uniref:pumilio homolog 5-like n=1 Tax=Apium graveolens TaxID=4045 RepID=UPI003D795EB9